MNLEGLNTTVHYLKKNNPQTLYMPVVIQDGEYGDFREIKKVSIRSVWFCANPKCMSIREKQCHPEGEFKPVIELEY